MVRMILDCDPGHDDAVALLMAAKHPDLELLGVTVVAGNQTLEKTVNNACKVLQHLGLSHVPVYRGMGLPMVRTSLICPEIHGATGLDGPVFAPQTKFPEPMHAVEYLVRTLRAATEPITLVTTGPMTNVGMALRLAPDIIDKVERFVCMGGSMGLGNISPAAEFNILADAEAAHLVFTAGKPVVMLGLDVTRKVAVDVARIDRYEKKYPDNVAAKLFCDMMRFFCSTQKAFFGLDAGPLHDPCTVAYLIDPSLYRVEAMHVDVELRSDASYGRTNCDIVSNIRFKANRKGDRNDAFDALESNGDDGSCGCGWLFCHGPFYCRAQRYVVRICYFGHSD